MSCGCSGLNPCQTPAANTAACETLPSQIENFTLQFFGEITKSEIDGEVVWNLPCGLDVGLPNNPRDPGEGLACYFLRLFQDGIVGLTGPQGDPGADGDNGFNAFTVTLASFTQPTLSAPTVQLTTINNPAIIDGMYVFVEDSGWYVVDAVDGTGSVWLTLTRPLTGAPAVVPVGRLVVPSGYPGESITGAQGPVGAQGPAGAPGASFTATWDQVSFYGGADWDIPVTYTQPNFGSGPMQMLLPDAGTYILTAHIQLGGLAAADPAHVVDAKFRNSTAGSDVDMSFQSTSRIATDEQRVLTISTISVIGTPGTTIRLQLQCTGAANSVTVQANGTHISYVRIA
jgi:hypothetical protein